MSTKKNIRSWLQIVLACQISIWVFVLTGRSFFRSGLAIAGVDINGTENKVLQYLNSNYVLLEGLLFGLCFGTIFYFIHRFIRKTPIRNMSFGRIILVHTALYFFALNLVVLVVSVILVQFDFFPFDNYSDLLKIFSFEYDMVPMGLLQMALVIIGINFMMEVNKKFGPGNLWNLFIGKYHQPVVEERIFMFLDLKDSTTHAEKLGHIKYSQLIQTCFLYLNDLITKCGGQIYQYVGDEAVLTWDMNDENAVKNSLELYYRFQDLLISKTDKFEKEYGFVPTFKAGLNEGSVTAAEVGNIKREIAYHGDVLNTCSRIQEQCNVYKKKLLISEVFANKMANLNQFKKELIGSLSLKGKTEVINVYSVERA